MWSSGVTTITASNLFAGSYSCFVTDANGCTDTAHYYLSEPTIINSTVTVTDVGCKGDATGEIAIVAMGGTQIPGIPGACDEGFSILLSSGLKACYLSHYHTCPDDRLWP